MCKEKKNTPVYLSFITYTEHFAAGTSDVKENIIQ